MANVFAQAEALAFGKTAERGRRRKARRTGSCRIACSRATARRTRSSLERLTPAALGSWSRCTSTACSRRARSGTSTRSTSGASSSARCWPSGSSPSWRARPSRALQHDSSTNALIRRYRKQKSRDNAKGNRHATRNDRPGPDGRQHGAAADEGRPPVRRLRHVPEAVRGAGRREGDRRGVARRIRGEARQAARGLADGARGGRRHDDRTTLAAAARGGRHRSSTAATPTTSTTSGARQELAPKGIHYVDVGTSGGVWGLERGYCMMIGGDRRGRRSASIRSSRRWRPARGDIARTPGREKVGGTAEQGYLHCGPNGAGHFVKMVHNGIEYGLMAAYAEGLGILAARQRRQADARDRRRDDAAARPRALPVRLQPARHRRGVAARQRDRLVAARPDGDRADQGPRAREVRRPGLGFRRRALDDQGRHRRGRAGAGADRRALRALQLARRGRLPEQAALGDALRVRRPRREAAATVMATASTPHSDALVFFGATGDLAYKKIFPALQAMIKRGHLERAGHRRRQGGLEPRPAPRARPRQPRRSTAALDAAAFAKLLVAAALRRRRLRRPATFAALRKQLGDGAAPGALPGDSARAVRRGRRAARQGRLHRRARASSSRSRSAATSPRAQTLNRILLALSTRRTSSASTTTSASGRCTTCCSSASPTRSSSRSGTATTSRACRSRWPRTSACRAAASSTTRPAPSATWCRTTSSRCCATWRWSRRCAPTARSLRDEKVKVLKAIAHARAGRRRARPVPRLPAGAGVAPDSTSRRSPRCGCTIDSWRWQGVPFYIRAGKNLPVTCTEVLVRLRRPPAIFPACDRAAEPPALPHQPRGRRSRSAPR